MVCSTHLPTHYHSNCNTFAIKTIKIEDVPKGTFEQLNYGVVKIRNIYHKTKAELFQVRPLIFYTKGGCIKIDTPSYFLNF